MAQFARQHKLELRFIEYMPLDAEEQLDARRRAFAATKYAQSSKTSVGTLEPVADQCRSQPATDYEYADGGGRVGFINSVTQPFCEGCDRLRMTADGKVRNCLFSTVEWDARAVMRGGGSDEQLVELIRDCVAAKKARPRYRHAGVRAARAGDVSDRRVMNSNMDRERIYLDNAATSWPKPDSVYQAVDRYLRELGAPAGRSGYAEALEANRLVEQARSAVARIVGAGSPDRIAFTLNGTDALNIAIHGVVREGDHVVTSQAEHNSVLRPLATLAAQGRITVTHVGCDRFGYIDPDDVRRALEAHPKTRLVALAHASNVTGAVQPLEEIGQAVRDRGALFLVDAAQIARPRAVVGRSARLRFAGSAWA